MKKNNVILIALLMSGSVAYGNEVWGGYTKGGADGGVLPWNINNNHGYTKGGEFAATEDTFTDAIERFSANEAGKIPYRETIQDPTFYNIVVNTSDNAEFAQQIIHALFGHSQSANIARINSQNPAHFHNTALMMAVYEGNPYKVGILLSLGADPQIVNGGQLNAYWFLETNQGPNRAPQIPQTSARRAVNAIMKAQLDTRGAYAPEFKSVMIEKVLQKQPMTGRINQSRAWVTPEATAQATRNEVVREELTREIRK